MQCDGPLLALVTTVIIARKASVENLGNLVDMIAPHQDTAKYFYEAARQALTTGRGTSKYEDIISHIEADHGKDVVSGVLLAATLGVIPRVHTRAKNVSTDEITRKSIARFRQEKFVLDSCPKLWERVELSKLRTEDQRVLKLRVYPAAGIPMLESLNALNVIGTEEGDRICDNLRRVLDLTKGEDDPSAQESGSRGRRTNTTKPKSGNARKSGQKGSARPPSKPPQVRFSMTPCVQMLRCLTSGRMARPVGRIKKKRSTTIPL